VVCVRAIGEIAMRFGSEMRPHVGGVLAHMIPVLVDANIEPRLSENLSIALGRIAIVCPDAVAPYLDRFIRVSSRHGGVINNKIT
jgi:transportin-1